MKSTNLRRFMAAALLLALLLALTGCGEKSSSAAEATPDTSTASAAPGGPAPALETPAATKKPAKKPSLRGAQTDHTEQTSAQETASAQDDASLAALRARMDDQPFAVAYLGYIGGLFDEGFDAGFPAWLAESDPRLLETYPFISEIDQDHILGGVGHLYCIVPHDEAASLAVNRVHWDGEALEYVVDEVAYRAETGEPILLFANLDGDESIADAVVTVVSNNGQVCECYPALNEDGTVMLPSEEVGDRLLDFTEYADVGVGRYGQWLVNGWLGPTALSLAGDADIGCQTWSFDALTAGGSGASYMLTFYPGDETGGAVDLNWSYRGQSDYEEQWSGFWTLETAIDQPSYVTLDLTRVGGLNYDTVDGPYYFSETYPLLLAPSGESMILAAGEHGIALPGMPDSAEMIEMLAALG